MKRNIHVVMLLCVLARPLMAAGLFLEPEQYFKRLESVGMNTTKIRAVAKKIWIERFIFQPSGAEAQYDFKINKLRIPVSYCTPGTSNIMFDLESTKMDTVTHEFCHAEDDFADDLLKSCKALTDADGMAKEDAMAALQTDLAAQEAAIKAGTNPRSVPAPAVTSLSRSTSSMVARRRLWLKSKISNHYKAWEIIGYYFGSVMNDVFFNAKAIVAFNRRPESYMRTAADVATHKESDAILLPPFLSKAKFAPITGQTQAYYQSTAIGSPAQITYYLDGRDAIFDKIADHTLGLHPPRDNQQLVTKLNQIHNTWIDGIRREIKALRVEFARTHPQGIEERSAVLGGLSDPLQLLGGSEPR